MRGVLQSLSFALLLTIAIGQDTAADPILVADGRALGRGARVNDIVVDPFNVTPPAPFAFFDGVTTVTASEGSAIATATASLRSSVSPTRFHATGTAESFANAPDVGDFASTFGFSHFGIDFELPFAYRFTLTDFMVADDLASIGTGKGARLVNVFISNAAASFPFTESLGGGARRRQFTRTGLLSAGFHSLQADAITEAMGNSLPGSGIGSLSHHRASFELDFQLTPVPEPGSMLLLGSGLIAFAARRARRTANVRTCPPTSRRHDATACAGSRWVSRSRPSP